MSGLRDLFPTFYNPTDSEFKELWARAAIVPDANVLLNLHRYTQASREQLFEVLEKVKERLWVPHMFATEYHLNLANVLAETGLKEADLLNQAESRLQPVFELLESARLEEKKLPALSPTKMVKQLNQLIDRWRKQATPRFKVSNLFGDSQIFSRVDNLLAGRIGPSPQQELLKEYYSQGEDRFKRKLPPGFKDANKGEDTFLFEERTFERRFGDLIGWFQILDRFGNKVGSEAQTTSVLFVTDDVKSDWWAFVKGQRYGPRRELREEARSRGIDLFWVYDTESFLMHANLELEINVDQTVIEEAHSVRQEHFGSPGAVVASIIGGSLADRLAEAARVGSQQQHDSPLLKVWNHLDEFLLDVSELRGYCNLLSGMEIYNDPDIEVQRWQRIGGWLTVLITLIAPYDRVSSLTSKLVQLRNNFGALKPFDDIAAISGWCRQAESVVAEVRAAIRATGMNAHAT